MVQVQGLPQQSSGLQIPQGVKKIGSVLAGLATGGLGGALLGAVPGGQSMAQGAQDIGKMFGGGGGGDASNGGIASGPDATNDAIGRRLQSPQYAVAKGIAALDDPNTPDSAKAIAAPHLFAAQYPWMRQQQGVA